MSTLKKIVIIDDDLSINDVLERFLTRQSLYDVKTFSCAQSALEEILQGSYDLVLTDVMMPMLNGLDILKKIKENSPKTKVILMTAYSTDKKIEQGKQLKADNYIEKPFKSLKNVEEIINTTLKSL